MPALSPKPSAVFGGVVLTILILAFMITRLDTIIIWLFGAAHPEISNFVSRSSYVVFVFVIWYYASRFEKQPLLLWKEKNYSVGTLLSHIFALFGIIMMTLFIANLILVLIHKKETSEVLRWMANFFRSNKLLLVYTALTAGVTEELIFRGYLLPRLELLLKNPWWAIFISSLIFGLCHYRIGTIQNMLDPFIIGAILAVYYWRYRNIKVTIIFHFLWDLVGLFILISRK